MRKIFVFILIILFTYSGISQIKIKDLNSEFITKLNEIKNAEDQKYDLVISQLIDLKDQAKKRGTDNDLFHITYELALIYMNNTGEFDKVIPETNFLESYAIKNKDDFAVADVLQMRGVSFLELQFTVEGLENLEKALVYLKKVPESNDVFMKFSILYNNIRDVFIKKEDDKQEYFYLQKSLEYALKIKETDLKSITDKNLLLAFINNQLGDYYYKINKIELSKNHYESSLNLFEKYGNKYTLYGKIEAIVRIGNLNFEQNNFKEAINIARKGLKIQNEQTDMEVKLKLYDILQKSYLKLNVTDSASYYVDLYSKTNSIIKSKSSMMQNKAITNYTENLKTTQNNTLKNIILICLLAVSLIILISFYYVKKYNKKQKNIYATYIKNFQQTKDSVIIEDNIIEKFTLINQKTTSEVNIPESTYKIVLDKLSKFERKEKFLNKNVTLASLATDLDINTKYLSQIINEQKGKNFNNYINSLRIKYITQKLIEDPKFSKYKISYLAEICGFASREVFTQIFKKETGVNPSFFIKQIIENSNKEVV